MGESNSHWGLLAEADAELARAWDGYKTLPDIGDNEALDSFCARKRITIESLVRSGARLAELTTLAFAFPDGIKYRDLITDGRWASADATWLSLKIIPATQGSLATRTVVIAEGESDGARLSILFPAFDVAVMPSGAMQWSKRFTEQLQDYGRVLIGLDADAAGQAGAKKIVEALPQAIRFAPPHNDWCDTPDDEIPDVPAPITVLPDIVFGGALIDLEAPENASWFEDELLPIGGQLVLHAAAKSFKTFMALDMMSAIATGSPWCCFEPTEEPARVCVIQFEIPWPYYKRRCELLRSGCEEPKLWDQNFGSWRPLMHPYLAAGNTEQEDAIIGPLVKAGVQVVMIDPVRRMMGVGDINSEQDARKALGFFERLQAEGITVVFTHHDSKQGSRNRGGDMLAMTGSGAFSGDADSILSVALPRSHDLTSAYRNVHFLLRNAPSPSTRSFQMREDGHTNYALSPWGDEAEAGADDADVPII